MIFGFGFDAYQKGNWMHAKKFFEKALSYSPKDQPSLNLLEYMEQ